MHGLKIVALLHCLVWVPVLASQGLKTAGCGSCHRAEAATQPLTPMSRSLELPGANSVLQAHPRLTLRLGEFNYTVETKGTDSSFTVTDGSQELSVPILWSFGTNAQSWVLSRDGKLYEGMVSYYPALNGLAVTLGDERITPHNVGEAMGRELLKDEATNCFGCHTTGGVVDGEFKLDKLKPGVTCEHCHERAGEHMADAALGRFNSAPPDLGALSSEDVSSFCGQCHRTWATVVRNRWMSEVNVRFQPYRLATSRCFNGTDARIGCLACHNPHVDVSLDPADYDPKCLACHAPSALKPGATVATSVAVNPEARICPVAKSGCASCHMPKVQLPGGHQTFTDHNIRIVRPDEPYPD